jgi:hypothetical protein
MCVCFRRFDFHALNFSPVIVTQSVSRLSGKRAKVYVHKQKPDVILAHRGTQGLADKWTDLAAVIGGRRKQSRRFQHAQAVTNRVRAAYPQAQITAVGHSLGGTLAQDTKGSDKQITFNKATAHTMCCTNDAPSPKQTTARLVMPFLSYLMYILVQTK